MISLNLAAFDSDTVSERAQSLYLYDCICVFDCICICIKTLQRPTVMQWVREPILRLELIRAAVTPICVQIILKYVVCIRLFYLYICTYISFCVCICEYTFVFVFAYSTFERPSRRPTYSGLFSRKTAKTSPLLVDANAISYFHINSHKFHPSIERNHLCQPH